MLEYVAAQNHIELVPRQVREHGLNPSLNEFVETLSRIVQHLGSALDTNHPPEAQATPDLGCGDSLTTANVEEGGAPSGNQRQQVHAHLGVVPDGLGRSEIS